MDTVPLSNLDCESNNDTEVSLVERRSSFWKEPSTSESSIIHIQNLNPSKNWQLPAILPNDVCKLNWWSLKIATQIKVSSIDVSFTHKDEPVHINLLEKHQIDWEKYQGFKYVHLGAIKLGLGPLVHPDLLVSSLCVSIDTRHWNFADALIGSFTVPLHDGPAFGTIYPKYSVSFEDPYIYDLLKSYIVPKGFNMDTWSKIIQLKGAVVDRFGNDTLPPLRSHVHQISHLHSVVESEKSKQSTPVTFD